MRAINKILRLKNIAIIAILILFTFHSLLFTNFAQAGELEDIEKELANIANKLEQSQSATAPLETTLKGLEQNLANIQDGIKRVEASFKDKERKINEGDKNLTDKQILLEKRIRNFFIKDKRLDSLTMQMLFGTKSSLGQTIRLAGYNQRVLEQDRNEIVQLVLFIKNLEERKEELKDEQARLIVVKEKTDEQAAFFRKEVAGAKAYQSDLQGQIAQLSARQQALVSAKTELFSTSVGDVPLSDDPASRPDYSPGFSPAFAAFSFGAPHFKGMSQYGAYGRAKSGQNYEQILRAYYGGGIEIKDHDLNAQITVEGYGIYSLEEYTKRIYEVPNSWGDEGGMEALKAQAIAARSYALARGGTICATESCQVFKPEPKGGNWERAVNETQGKVVYANGSPFSTWYASTSGGYQESYSSNGYSTPGFWDTSNGRDGWTSNAYEKIAGSSWFYKGWYKTRSGKSCGRPHPWLNNEEMSDIVNAVIVYSSGGDTSGLFPEDIQSCFGGGDNPWSKDRMAQEADKHGGRVSSISGVVVQYSSDGTTGKITFQTNRGNIALDGNIFYKAFNLRAPGAIHLKSGLYNIEKK